MHSQSQSLSPIISKSETGNKYGNNTRRSTMIPLNTTSTIPEVVRNSTLAPQCVTNPCKRDRFVCHGSHCPDVLKKVGKAQMILNLF